MGIGKSLLGATIIAGLLLASCAPAAAPTVQPTPMQIGATAETKAAASPAAPAGTPKPAGDQARYGGVLAVSSVADPPSLDTHQETTLNTQMVVAPAYNMLVEYQPHLGKGLYPGLAESWDISKDGLVYTFNIRKGVKFHDGAPFTPQDAAVSVTRLWKPPRGVRTVLAGVMDAIKSVEATDSQVKITLDYPFSPLLAILSYAPSVIYPKHVVEAKGDMKTTVVGTGPFQFKSYTPGVSVELVKSSNYWVAGRPYLDKVSFLILKDSWTRFAALRTGRIKMTGRGLAILTPSEMETIKREKPNFALYASGSPLYPWFFMNLRSKPFNDKKVRQAISLVIDRPAALKVVAQGQGSIGRPFAIEGWGIPDDERSKLPGYRQPKDADIAEAKRLMAEAGYAQGLKFTILARTMLVSKESAVFLTSQLAPIGIDAAVEVVEDAVFWDRGRNAQHQAMVYTPSTTIPDVEYLARFLVKGGSLNYSGNDDDQKLNELWEKQRRVTDEAQRKAIIQDVERYIQEEVTPGIPLVVPSVFLALWPEVKNFSPGFTEFGNNNLQEIWLAS